MFSNIEIRVSEKSEKTMDFSDIKRLLPEAAMCSAPFLTLWEKGLALQGRILCAVGGSDGGSAAVWCGPEEKMIGETKVK